ncbi:MAG: two-component sensor histidine kinase [Flavobacteriaceae bacterium]|jgi:two-component sensor histidine kinase
MSLVHQRLHQSNNFSEISFNEYAQQLIDNITYLFNAKRGEFKLTIPKHFTVDIETAIPLGLIVNEIGSNFFKHCVQDGAIGNTLSIDVKSTGKDNYTIICRDNGKGFPEGTEIEGSNTLGLELISSLCEQIETEFRFFNDNGAEYQRIAESVN